MITADEARDQTTPRLQAIEAYIKEAALRGEYSVTFNGYHLLGRATKNEIDILVEKGFSVTHQPADAARDRTTKITWSHDSEAGYHELDYGDCPFG